MSILQEKYNAPLQLSIDISYEIRSFDFARSQETPYIMDVHMSKQERRETLAGWFHGLDEDSILEVIGQIVQSHFGTKFFSAQRIPPNRDAIAGCIQYIVLMHCPMPAGDKKEFGPTICMTIKLGSHM